MTVKRTVVVGGGPIGLFCGIALARRGQQVVLVDRDAGPAADGSWKRQGVMQFMHPHFFRPQVRQALLAEMPDVLDGILAAGAEPRLIPGMPEEMTALACRRWVFERAFRAAAHREPGLAMVTGHVDRIAVDNGQVRGVIVEGATVEADLVISVSGRTSPLGHEFRADSEGGLCGFSYVSRMYRARPGHTGCESPTPVAVIADGYINLVLPQDDNTLSLLISRPSADHAMIGVRENAGWDAVAVLIPNFQPYVDRDRFEPITDVLVGGGLTNTYRDQGPEPGVPPARGLFFVGDSASTTNPAAGRGIALGLRTAQHLLSLIDDTTIKPDDASRALDQWCRDNLRPWFLDHVDTDAALLRQYSGEDVDIDAPLPSYIVGAAAEQLPEIMPAVGAFFGMLAPPNILRTVEDKVRDLLRTGWRPPTPGPSAAELADPVNRALAAAGSTALTSASA